MEENGERSVFAAPHTVPGVDLMFEGDGNTLCLHKPFYFDRCEWLLSDGSYVEIQSSRYEMKKSTFSILNGGRVFIGKISAVMTAWILPVLTSRALPFKSAMTVCSATGY